MSSHRRCLVCLRRQIPIGLLWKSTATAYQVGLHKVCLGEGQTQFSVVSWRLNTAGLTKILRIRRLLGWLQINLEEAALSCCVLSGQLSLLTLARLKICTRKRIRGYFYNEMRYINLRFTYLFYLLITSCGLFGMMVSLKTALQV